MTGMIAEAIDRYHALLTDSVATRAHEELTAGLKARRLYFGERPLCRVLRPHFYLDEQWQFLKARSEIILRAFAKAHAACMEQADLRQQLDLEPYEENLFSLDKDVDTPWTSSRLDAFFLADKLTLRFVEYNAETPAGIGYGDALADAFMDMDIMRQFQQVYDVHPFPGLGHLTGALLHGYRMWGGQETPQIGIIDWADVPTLNEHEITREYFERQGLKTILADPRDMEYRQGHLWVRDFRVDLIYKRVLISELVQRMGSANPIIDAIRDRAVMMTNSLSAKLLAKKASLAFLSDEANSNLFDAEEREAINAHIPWTRRVFERQTNYHGQQIDLLPFISDNQQQLVLKPNDEYGGKGVVMGWAVTADEWQAAIHESLNHPFVVQEKVEVVYRDFPMMMPDGSLDISSRFVDADPYVFYGKTVGGCLTRLSSEALLNVTAGGGSVVPMFVLSRK
jgi:uncharacterized circularly permuted ATP-grasp superfamily protein